MFDLERKLGPLRLRAWGLVANFVGNLGLLFGLSQLLNKNGGWPWLIGGASLTIACIVLLAAPSKD